MLQRLPENLIEKAIKELGNSEFPTLIWGAGETSHKILNFLSTKGIKTEGFLVNREFIERYMATKEEEPCVFELENYLSYHKCNLIVGFSGYDQKGMEMFKEKINKLYVLDFIGALCIEDSFSMITHEFYEKNRNELQWLDSHLSDNKSKTAIDEYVFQKMSGKYYKSDYSLDQYFPRDIIQLSEKEVFVDCGAYHGENTIDFIEQLHEKEVGEYEKIICVEADKDNAQVMREKLKQYPNVEIVSAGVWDKPGVLQIVSGTGRTSRISESGADKVEVETIDNILKGQKATYIKMDIEGAELKALYGARDTIKKYKPKLAICIYHKQEDLVSIPRYIYSLRDDYKFYIRNHSPYGIETVLYAV